MFSKSPKVCRLASIELHENEEPVNGNLAYDIPTLNDMREKGLPISSTVESMYYDGTSNVSFDLPLDQQRGVDIADLWAEDKMIHRKLSKAKVTSFDLNPNKT